MIIDRKALYEIRGSANIRNYSGRSLLNYIKKCIKQISLGECSAGSVQCLRIARGAGVNK